VGGGLWVFTFGSGLRRALLALVLALTASFGFAQALEVYVSDAAGFNVGPWQILTFDGNGENPSVFIDTNGDLLVSDYDGVAIKRFDASGQYLGDFITDVNRTEGVAFFANGDILIGNGATNSVKRFDSDGNYIEDFIASRTAGLKNPNAIVIREVPTSVELDHAYLFPAAAKAEGAEGSFFLTDAVINNAGGSTASYAFRWLPRNHDNADPMQLDAFTLEAGASVVYADVLGAAFGLETGAVGALAVVSDSSDLRLMSRTFNQLPAKVGGTFGQAIPGLATDDLIPAGVTRRIVFFVENDAFRTNLGLANGTGSEIDIEWERFTADGVSVSTGSLDLPAWGNTQLNSVFFGEAPVNGGAIDVWTTTEGGAFAAYGSLLDNTTSDPTTVLPQ
jgi:hypothetical protein